MKRLLSTLCLLLLGNLVQAQPVKLGQIEIEQAWARPTAAQTANGAAYLTLTNHGHQADRLLAVSGTVAGEIQIHRTSMDGGVMRMRQLADGVEVPAGKRVKFAPGGLHIMLMGLKAPLKPGEHFVLTLQFAKAGKTDVTVEVHDQQAEMHEMETHDMNMPMH